MARPTTWNLKKLNAEIAAADAVLDPLLESAKITVIKVEGKDVPASDAPVAAKIQALSALANSSGKTQEMSDLVVANDELTRQIESVSAENTRLHATNAAQTQDIARLTAELATAKASVATLTASTGELSVRHEAALRQVNAETARNNEVNTEISRLCIAANVIDLTTEDGKPLAKDATETDRLAAANRIPVADKLKAYKGAVNAAIAKTGVDTTKLPAGGLQGKDTSGKPELKGRERMKAAMKIQGVNL